MTRLIIDGSRVELLKPDLNKDGIVSDIENIDDNSYDEQITDISQPTELGESLRELNLDSLEADTRMSGIDMRSRLHFVEIPSILAVDTLVGFKFLPTSCLAFTRQKKRLSVSLDGKGRGEIVDIVGRKREDDVRKGGIMSNINNKLFGGNNNG